MTYLIDQVKPRPGEQRTFVEFTVDDQPFCTWLHDGVLAKAGQTAQEFLSARLDHLGDDWRLFLYSGAERPNMVALIGREAMQRQGMRWPDPDEGSTYLVTQGMGSAPLGSR